MTTFDSGDSAPGRPARVTLPPALNEDGEPNLSPIHPGEVLYLDYLEPLGITAYQLAKATGLSQTHIGDILRGERSITALSALRLSAHFGTSPELWLNLQNRYDVERARKKFADKLAAVPRHPRVMEAEREMREGEAEQTRERNLITT